MYNEELKRNFLRQYSNTITVLNTCEYTFNKLEKYENEWEADFCTRSAEEITPVIEELCGMRVQSKYQRMSILKSYVEWCIANGVRGANDAIMHIQVFGIEKIRRQMVSSPAHLNIVLNQLCSPEDFDTTDNMLRAYCWLLYAGMKEDDTRTVTAKDIDFKHAEIKYGVKSLPLYRQAVAAFEKCIDLTMIAHYTDPDKSMRSYINRVEGPQILRGIYRVPSIKTLRVELAKRGKNRGKGDNDGKEMQISTQRIWMSGLFYKLYENERAGFKPDFKQVAVEHMCGREYSANTKERDIMLHIARDYEKNYQLWKLAFDYL